MEHRTTDELEAGADEIAGSPVGAGRLELIVRRPAVGEREVLDDAELDLAAGLVGDTWSGRAEQPRTADGSPHPEMQLNIMNVRAVALIAGPPERWPLAGDQLYVDLHLGAEELPPGTRLRIGDAVIEVTGHPAPRLRQVHAALRARRHALRQLRRSASASTLRGINAKVVVPGTIRTGDDIVAADVLATADYVPSSRLGVRSGGARWPTPSAGGGSTAAACAAPPTRGSRSS